MEQYAEQLPDNTPISEIEPISEGGVSINDRGDLKLYVEAPLLDACQLLFDKGIKTIFSGANKYDVGSRAHICVEYDSLTLANQKIAESLGQIDVIHGAVPYKKGVYLEVPISENTTLGEIKKAYLEIVDKFEDQSGK